MIFVPDTLKDVASFSDIGYDWFPDHIHYKASELNLPIDEDSLHYEGENVRSVEVYFGVNEAETKERRQRYGWSPVDDDDVVDGSEAGPIPVDVIVYFIFGSQMGERLETSFYVLEVSEHISSSEYENLLQEEATRTIKTSSKTQLSE